MSQNKNINRLWSKIFLFETYTIYVKEKKKVSRTPAKEAHTAGAYPGLCSMKKLKVLLLPPWMGC